MSDPQRNEDLLPDDPPPRHRDEDFDAHDPLEAEPPPSSPEPVVVPRWIQRGTTTGSGEDGGGSASSGSWASKSSSRWRGGGSSGSRSSLRWGSLIAPVRQSMGGARRRREHPLHRRRGRRPRSPHV